jgi:hypothetical protein
MDYEMIWDVLQDQLLAESAIEPEPGEPGWLGEARIGEQWQRFKEVMPDGVERSS